MATTTTTSAAPPAPPPPPIGFRSDWEELVKELGRRDCGIAIYQSVKGNKYVIFAGGRNTSSVLLRSILILDVKKRILTKAARLSRPKYHCPAIVVGSMLYIFGGIGHGGWLDEIEIFDLTEIEQQGSAALLSSATTSGGSAGVLPSSRIKRHTTMLKTRLPKPLADATLACYRSRYIYVVGGYDCQAVYEFDTLDLEQQLQQEPLHHMNLYTIASQNSGKKKKKRRKNLTMNVRILPPMNESRLLPTVLITQNKQLVVVGGYGGGEGEYLASAERFDLGAIMRRSPTNSDDDEAESSIPESAAALPSWTLMKCKLPIPGLMMAMGLVGNGNDLILTGGRDEDGRWLNSSFVLKYTDKDWIHHRGSFPPYPGNSERLHISMTVAPGWKQMWYVSADHKLYSLSFVSSTDVEAIHFGPPEDDGGDRFVKQVYDSNEEDLMC